MQQTSGQLQTERPDVLPISPGPSDAVDMPQPELRETGLRRKDSVARITWDGLSYVVAVSLYLRVRSSFLAASTKLRKRTLGLD